MKSWVAWTLKNSICCDVKQLTSPQWTRAAVRGRQPPSVACMRSLHPIRGLTSTRACWEKRSRACSGQTSRPSPLRAKSHPAVQPNLQFCSGQSCAMWICTWGHICLHVSLHVFPCVFVGGRWETCPETGWVFWCVCPRTWSTDYLWPSLWCI